MKRSLLVAAAAAVVLTAAPLPAVETSAHKEAAAQKMVTPDWHYRWQEGRWWYWMPESNDWMVWTGSTWVPYAPPSSHSTMRSVSQAKSDANGYAGGEARENGHAGGAAYSGGENCRPGRATGSTAASSAGYGWTWGAGTAFRNAPGARF